MRKVIRITLWSIASIVVVLFLLGAIFMYKVKNGFPVSYETDKPSIEVPEDKLTVLLFSKATGFRHAESIDAGKEAFQTLSSAHDWYLYSTEEGGIFNSEQLSQFDVVVFNNCTGRLLNDEQQTALEEYVNNGGRFIGIHGAGDDSHHWQWYDDNLIGASFSHHAMDPQMQAAEVRLNAVPDSVITDGLPATWTHTDEWYVFFDSPRSNGFQILYTIDGESIKPGGNLLWIKDKDFGMGKDHPVAWYRQTGKGRTFYTSIGHDATAWKQEAFMKMLENAVTTR